MNTNRRGKIARLPRKTRHELNRRISDGEPAAPLLAWLNEQPKVRKTLAAQFDGRAVSERNLSEWRQGGYRDWLHQQEALEMAEHLGEEAQAWEEEGRAPLSETLSFWLAARYAVATRRIAEADDPESWRLMREMCRDVVRLRRGDQHARRLQLEDEKQDRGRELLELERARTRQKSDAECMEWASKPENLARVRRKRRFRREQIQELRARAWGIVPDGLEHGDPEGAAYKWKMQAQEAAEAVEAAVQKAAEAKEQAEKWEAAAKALRASRGEAEEEEEEEEEEDQADFDEAEAEEGMVRDAADGACEWTMENGEMENGGAEDGKMENLGVTEDGMAEEGAVAHAGPGGAPSDHAAKIERSGPGAAQAGSSLQTDDASTGVVGPDSATVSPAVSSRGLPAQPPAGSE